MPGGREGGRGEGGGAPAAAPARCETAIYPPGQGPAGAAARREVTGPGRPSRGRLSRSPPHSAPHRASPAAVAPAARLSSRGALEGAAGG